MPLTQVVAGNRILASDLNQFYNILKGVAASGEAVTLIFNAAGSFVLQPSSDPATGTELIQIKNNAGTVQCALSSDGKVYAADGTVALPGLTWEQEKATGLYRISSNKIGVSINNSEKVRIDATGLSLDGGTNYVNNYGDQTNRWRYTYSGEYAPLEVTVSGTGSVAAPGPQTMRRYVTGATSASVASSRTIIRNVAQWAVGKLRRLELQLDFVNIDANTSAYLVLTTESATTLPSLTADHIGIKNVAGVVSFTTADGTTEQTTDITASVSAVNDYTFVVMFDGTTALLYITGVLRATHATNVPRATLNAAVVWRAYIVNSAAASKTLDLDRIDALFAV